MHLRVGTLACSSRIAGLGVRCSMVSEHSWLTLHARYEAEANKQELPAEEYRAMMRLLNEKQLKIP